ncbi:M15 family metallopeptidase [Gorillibacterium timonense]|uniref:M15 family metallopeptidase n=1 Tax=Gorillibacterium timonense TaxID=1689269 RepID=UPI003709BF2B
MNKTRKLPADYVPADLVEPNVRFSFSEKLEKRKMRKEAAGALEKLFAGAKKDGVILYAVSGYRSYKTQESLFNAYVKRDGEAEASRYSARAGTSEHQTGLAMDVSSKSVNYQLSEKFGETAEGKWLAKHASEYGFIIRYPKGTEKITGYMYEPWHIRYLGKELAQEVVKQGVTLDEYFNQAIPVTAP